MSSRITPYQSLGFTAKNKRRILPGREYNQYFGSPMSNDKMYGQVTTEGTVELIGEWAKQFKGQSKRIADRLKANTTEKTLQNIWDFCYNHIDYEEDKPGVEQLRTPNRIWADRKADCDCYTLFISTILLNLNIPHLYRTVKMYGNSYYQHIYVIVPKDKNKVSSFSGKVGSDLGTRSDYWVIDPVVDAFDFEPKSITYKFDLPMIPIQLLDGIANTIPSEFINSNIPVFKNPQFNEEFDSLGSTIGGLGCPADKKTEYHNIDLCNEFSQLFKKHLENTLTELNSIPKHTSVEPYRDVLINQLSELIRVWDNPETRFAAAVRAYQNSSPNSPALTFFEAIAFFSTYQMSGPSGLAGLRDWWNKNIAKPLNRAYDKIENVFEKVWDELKDFTQNIGANLKKLGRILLRWNPLTMLLRFGLLASIATNVSNVRGNANLYRLYKDWPIAKKNGHLWANWSKSKRTYELLHRVTVERAKASEGEFADALIGKFSIKKVREASDKNAEVQSLVNYTTPLFVGTLTYNYYGESNGERLSPSGIMVTDTIGEKGWVVLHNGVPSIEAVAMKIHREPGTSPDSPGTAYIMDADGVFYETTNGSWQKAAYPNQVIEPFPKYRNRYYAEDSSGTRTYDVVEESKWNQLHIIVFNQEKSKAKANGTIWSLPSSASNQDSGNGSGVSTGPSTGSGTWNPGDIINIPIDTSKDGEYLGRLGAVAVDDALITAGITAAIAVIQWVVSEIKKHQAGPEPDLNDFSDGSGGGSGNGSGSGSGLPKTPSKSKANIGNLLMAGAIATGLISLITGSENQAQPVKKTEEKKPLSGPKKARKSKTNSDPATSKKKVTVSLG
ncbi:MAG: hypothetical protein EP332_06395 [Bacteroidetes bacterium]|nr:MAG: hypothetical protein EP332_06395 [Bacteroidota bacterium]